MIATDSITKLNTSVVYVAGDMEPGLMGPGLLLGAELTGLSQIIDAPEPRPSPEGVILSSMRNQLTVTINSNRLVFGDASGEEPAREDFPGRVAQAAEYIGRQSSQIYTTIGLNFEIESESDDKELPSHVMLDRLVREDTLNDTEYDLVGASARLWYVAHDRLHDLRIEPRGNQYDGLMYFAGLSVRIMLEDKWPSAEWLSQALNEEYGDFERVLTKVLEPKERQ